MKVLDLFSGIGGFSLGLERAGMKTVAFCEIEEYPRKVLRKHWPDVPIFEDIKKLNGEDCGPIDLICGGYPCQPFSTAGKRAGEADDRALWPEYLRLIREIRPSWIIGENVAGHISMGLDRVLSDLEAEGYSWEAFVIPACAVDAAHRRDRVWIVANAIGNSLRQQSRWVNGQGWTKKQAESEHDGGKSSMADSKVSNDRGCNTGAIERQKNESGKSGSSDAFSDTGSKRLEGCAASFGVPAQHTWTSSAYRWSTEPRVGRVANGFSRWMVEPNISRTTTFTSYRRKRLKALGNAVVPQVVEMIGQAIMAVDGKTE